MTIATQKYAKKLIPGSDSILLPGAKRYAKVVDGRMTTTDDGKTRVLVKVKRGRYETTHIFTPNQLIDVKS